MQPLKILIVDDDREASEELPALLPAVWPGSRL
jgi:hypothetical protein